MWGKVVLAGQPETREKIIKGSYAGGIARIKSADDRVSRNKLKLIDPFGNGKTFHRNGQQIRAQHTRCGPGFGAEF